MCAAATLYIHSVEALKQAVVGAEQDLRKTQQEHRAWVQGMDRTSSEHLSPAILRSRGFVFGESSSPVSVAESPLPRSESPLLFSSASSAQNNPSPTQSTSALLVVKSLLNEDARTEEGTVTSTSRGQYRVKGAASLIRRSRAALLKVAQTW